ncbi:hypothetical protein OIU79_015854 [Salix purpurea]|uniref:Uncharacterized protein n=1 Tax=Salix purpurea TaxID=77065 RepID=A0A9Q0PD80_SALPP|nr:hypothetical protein OIU79_015854 [Salix purpurea]
MEKELIPCILVVSIIVSAINFPHNNIYATSYCHNISQFHSFNLIEEEFCKLIKNPRANFPSPRKTTLIPYQKIPLVLQL